MICNFSDFINGFETIQENKAVLDYLNGRITEIELDIEFSIQNINEGLGDWLKEIKDKVLNWSIGIFKSIINKIIDSTEFYILKEGGKKVFDVLKKILNTIKKFQEKHPLLFKIIVMFIVIVVIMIATASTAYAQSTGNADPAVTKNILNMAIGMLNDTKVSGGHSSFDVTEAMAYLIKLRDGDMEKTKFIFSKESQQIAQAAITTVEQSMEQY